MCAALLQAQHASLGERREALQGALERAQAARAGQEAKAAAPAASLDALVAAVHTSGPPRPCSIYQQPDGCVCLIGQAKQEHRYG